MGRNKQSRQQNKQSGNAIPHMGPWENLQYTWRMLRDPRVAPYAKVALPILALIYLISPIDVIPDMILGLGQVDDAGVIALIAYFLLTYVRRAGWATLLENGVPAPPTKKSESTSISVNDDIIDAQYRVISQTKQNRGQKAQEKSWGNS
jgi:uncharacterized membrane protein YkvA (DUF1232 family)